MNFYTHFIYNFRQFIINTFTFNCILLIYSAFITNEVKII